MTTRRQLLSGSLALLLASACNGDAAPDTGLPVDELDTDALSEAMLAVFDGAYADEVAQLMGLLAELKETIADELPATAAMLTVTFNQVALPLVQGLRDAKGASDRDAVVAAFSAHEDTAREGLAQMQRLLAQVDAETAGFAPVEGIPEYAEGFTTSGRRLREELGENSLSGAAVRGVQAWQTAEGRRIVQADPTVRDDLELAFRLSEVAAATKSLSTKGYFDGECEDFSELKFWYTAGSAVWKLIALLGLTLGGWSAMSGITAGIAVGLLGGVFSLSFIWILLILLFVVQLALKLNSILEQLDACACELRGQE